MLVKWIVCSVPQEFREAFSQAQEAWSIIADADGFYGQIGGWNHYRKDEASILALWRDMGAYQNFMDNIHDTVADNNSQEKTYSSIAVDLYKSVLDIPGEWSNLIEALPHASVLRVVDCLVKVEQCQHFEEVQSSIWNQGLAQVDGISGGTFNRHITSNNRYLVTTLWQDFESHLNYSKKRLPTLRDKANVVNDLLDLKAYAIQLEASWYVLPD